MCCKASFASAVYATVNPSLCPSVCPLHSGIMSKRGNAEGCSLHHREPSVFSILMLRMVNGDDPVQVKFECKLQRGRPPYENSRAVHILPDNSGTAIDSEKSLINANRKSTMGFPTSHQPRSCVTPSFPKMGSDTQICRPKIIKSLLQSFIV